MPELCDLTLTEASALIASREVTPLELTESALARIDDVDRRVGAFVTVTADAAREAAVRATAEIAAGRARGPLHGLPVAVKDLIDTAGVVTTSSSAVRSDRCRWCMWVHVPPRCVRAAPCVMSRRPCSTCWACHNRRI